MPRDSRWTGGLANRDWSAGKQVGRVIDPERLERAVARYLADCARYRGILSPKYHPAAESALKVIHHATGREADIIRAEFARQLEAASADG